MESTGDSYSQNQIYYLEVFARSASLLQMQHVWPHPRPLKPEFAFYKKKRKWFMYVTVWEALLYDVQ